MRPYTVSQITSLIKETLESRFPEVWIQGEISNFKFQSSGHLYFSLKDPNSQIGAAMFRQSATGLTALPKDGDQVIIRGELNVYPPRGSYQVVVRELHFVGRGALLLKLEELKRALGERGWFDPDHKKPLPPSPKRIGVVTSPTGAVIQDILQVLKRRVGGFSLLLNPVRVQGKEAACEIATAIEEFNRYHLVDVMIVGRGGGSLEDLWPFNEEIVAKAIYESQIPIISAVGHETDTTIADLVADLRAPTPSAAAELVCKARAEQMETLGMHRRRFRQTLFHLLDRPKSRLRMIGQHPFIKNPFRLLEPYQMRLDDLTALKEERMDRLLNERKRALLSATKRLKALQPLSQVRQMQRRAGGLHRALTLAAQTQVKRRREHLGYLLRHLEAVDPKNLLKKGYSILIAQKEGAVVTSKNQLSSGDRVRALLSDGEIALEVT
ncbi:MAG: exodeoxyribonuclease VII large subunit [Parachlamydiales bacterium]